MRANVLRAGAAFFAAAALSSCGGGGSASGGAGSSTSPTGNYFPVDANGRWIYAVTGVMAPTIVSNAGTQSVAGQTGQAFSTVDGSDGSASTDIYVVSATGVKDYAPAGADPFSAALNNIQVMTFPIEIGASYSQADVTVDSGIDFDGDGRSDQVRVRASVTVVGLETVSTPAATFAAALHQRQVIVETIIPSTAGFNPIDVEIDIDSWYGDGVGLVKSVTNVSGAGVQSSSTQSLTGYRVGSASTDTIPPTVQAVLPGPGAVGGLNASVSATFSEAIDAQSVTPAVFTVTDSHDAPVAGSTSAVGSTASFAPSQPWASGTYTATITTAATDLLGNALQANRSWTFTVDATGVGITSVTPADQANDVAVDAPIVIVFSEAPDPSTLTDANVRLASGNGSVATVLALAGNTLTVTPVAPLAESTLYTLTVYGVTDLFGNPMANEVLQQFRTTQGRFAYPVDLVPPLGSFVVSAIGDVDGDGIADVLLAVTGTGTASDGLYVLRGRADGTLAPATKVDLGSLTGCFVGTIAIGDLNGDGRPDVALGGSYCGVQVFHQAADGSLVLGEYLDLVTSQVIRIADIDGTGKNALLGIGGGLDTVSVWRQDVSGTLQFSEGIPLGDDSASDIQVGDVNGDGLADIVVTGGGADVAVFLQKSGHTFAAPTHLTTNSGAAAAIAVGDVNGDGRQDVVATTGGSSPTSITVFYQDATGTLGPATQVATYDSPMAVRIADIDGDGRSDIVVSHVGWNAVGIYLQQADGTLAPEVRYSAPYGSFLPDQMAVGDVDSDGRPDIVIGGSLIRQLPPDPGAMSVMTRSKAVLRAAGRKAFLSLPRKASHP